MAFWRRNRGQESSQPQSEVEGSESDEEAQYKEETPLSASEDRPGIADKVKFWEEQDRINKELIPRVLKQHELLSTHIASHEESRTQMAALDSRIGSQDESQRKVVIDIERRLEVEIRSVKRLALMVSSISVGLATLAIILALAL